MTDEAYCQPCVSPVWDTGLFAMRCWKPASRRAASVARALQWLLPRQVLDLKGDWSASAAAGSAGRLGLSIRQSPLSRSRRYRGRGDGAGPHAAATPTREFDNAIERGREWIEGLVSRNGGWAAFDADNTCYYLNSIPFADHGALLDPPTEDVTARCVSMLAQLGDKAGRQPRCAPPSIICAISSATTAAGSAAGA